MDFELSAGQVAIQNAVRAFATEQMAPHAAERDENNIYAVETLRAAGLGFPVCNEAPQLHGGYSDLPDYRVERILYDLRIHPFLEGIKEIMGVAIARCMLSETAPR